MQYILWKFLYLAVGPRCWGRSNRPQKQVHGSSAGERGGRWPLFNRPRINYTPAVVVWRRWEDGGEVEEQGEDLGAHTNTNTTSPETGISLAQVQRGSEELLAWKTEARKKPKKSSRSDLELQPRAATTIIKRWPRHHHRQKPTLRWVGLVMDCDLRIAF